MTALPLIRRTFTPDEYLVIERQAETRSEFVDGEIYAMAGASLAHVTINANLAGEIYVRLKGTPCRGMSQDMKVRAGTDRLFTYPDHIIVYGETRFRDTETDVLLNPLVIFEILSPSPEQYDRVTKFDQYKQIDSLREYVLIAQDQPRVEHYVRADDGSWRRMELTGLDAVLTLESAPAAVPLADLYDRIEFASAEANSAGGNRR
jgi:Uma2 family endonuclease